MKSCAPIAFAACSISSRVASGRPMAMFSATVPENRNASCVTMTTPRRSSARGQVAQIDAVEQHPALGGVVEAGQQLGERGLAGAGRADHGDGLPGRERQVEAGQHLAAGAVGEADAVEDDLAARAAGRDGRQLPRVRRARGRTGVWASRPAIFSREAAADW